MELTLTTPALLFPAISLLLLAYTNRFLALAALVRKIYNEYQDHRENSLAGQIYNLKKRLKIIKKMQLMGALAFFLCVFTMFLIFLNFTMAAIGTFTLSLLLLMVSLIFSVWEIRISIDALDIQLSGMEEKQDV